MLGTPRHLFIDIGECGLWLEKKVRGFGKAVVGDRVREPGVYGHGKKWALIMTIDCSGRKWFALNTVTRTIIETFESFIRRILTSPALVAGPQRTLLWGSLRITLAKWPTPSLRQVIFASAALPIAPRTAPSSLLSTTSSVRSPTAEIHDKGAADGPPTTILRRLLGLHLRARTKSSKGLVVDIFEIKRELKRVWGV